MQGGATGSGELSEDQKNQIIRNIIKKAIPETYLTNGVSGLTIEAEWTQNNLSDIQALENVLGKYNLKLNVELKDGNKTISVIHSQEAINHNPDTDLSEEFNTAFEEEKANNKKKATSEIEQDEDQGFDFDAISGESDEVLNSISSDGPRTQLPEDSPPLTPEEQTQIRERAQQQLEEVERTRVEALTAIGADPTKKVKPSVEIPEGETLSSQATKLSNEATSLLENKEKDKRQKAEEAHNLLQRMEATAKPLLEAKKKYAAQGDKKEKTLSQILAEETKMPAKGDVEDSIEALLNNLIAGIVALQKYFAQPYIPREEETQLKSPTGSVTAPTDNVGGADQPKRIVAKSQPAQPRSTETRDKLFKAAKQVQEGMGGMVDALKKPTPTNEGATGTSNTVDTGLRATLDAPQQDDPTLVPQLLNQASELAESLGNFVTPQPDSLTVQQNQQLYKAPKMTIANPETVGAEISAETFPVAPKKQKPLVVASLGPVHTDDPELKGKLVNAAKDLSLALQTLTDVAGAQVLLNDLQSIQTQMNQDPGFPPTDIIPPKKTNDGEGVDVTSGLSSGLVQVAKVMGQQTALVTPGPTMMQAVEMDLPKLPDPQRGELLTNPDPTQTEEIESPKRKRSKKTDDLDDDDDNDEDNENIFDMQQGQQHTPTPTLPPTQPPPQNSNVVDDALSITARPRSDSVQLTARKAEELKARTKQLNEKHLEFNDPIQMLKDDEYEVYKKQYGDDFFKKLAATMTERSDSVKDPHALNPKHKIQHRHAQRTQKIAYAVKFAEWGARRELMDAKNDPAVFNQYKDAKAAFEKVNSEYNAAKQVVSDFTAKVETIKAEQAALDPTSANHAAEEKRLKDARAQAELELVVKQEALDKIKPQFDAKEKAFNENPYAQAVKKVEVAEKIRHTFESLHALSKYRSRYTEDNYQQRMDELNKLMNRHDIGQDNKALLQQAVKHAQEEYNFHKTKMYKPAGYRSSRFDSTKDTFSLSDKKYKKDLKIQHYTEANGSKTVQVTFSFNRENMSGANRSRFNPAGHNYAYGEMKRQVSRMLDVAIGEYDKGSPQNPINICYGKSKSGKQLKQPDIALGIMMELKKRAIEENREFTVISPVDGKRVQITSEREMNPQEMAIMRHYATEKASMHAGKGVFKESTYGGTGILRHAKDASLTDPKAFKESTDSTRNEKRAAALDNALQGYLNKEIGYREEKLDKVFAKEAGRLEGPEKAAEKKKSASMRAN